MALVVFRKCRRVTDPCLFPPYPIAQLLFVMVTMMLLMLTPCLRSTPVRRRATGLTDVTVHAVTVPSRSTGPSALRRKCATQRECRGSVRRTRQSGPTRPSASCAFPRACGSLREDRNTGCRPYRLRNMAMRRWYGKRIHLGVMTVRANDGQSVGVKPGRHVRPSPVRLQSGLKLDALVCVAKCQSGRRPRYLVLATRCDASAK